MNQPECFTILDLVKRAILGKSVVITFNGKQRLGSGVVSDVKVTGDVDADWLVIKIDGQGESIEITCSDDYKITIIDP